MRSPRIYLSSVVCQSDIQFPPSHVSKVYLKCKNFCPHIFPYALLGYSMNETLTISVPLNNETDNHCNC